MYQGLPDQITPSCGPEAAPNPVSDGDWPVPFGMRGVRGQVVLGEGNFRLQQYEAVLSAVGETRMGGRIAGGERGNEESDEVELEHPAWFVDVGLGHAPHTLGVQVGQGLQQHACSLSEYLRAIAIQISWQQKQKTVQTQFLADLCELVKHW